MMSEDAYRYALSYSAKNSWWHSTIAINVTTEFSIFFRIDHNNLCMVFRVFHAESPMLDFYNLLFLVSPVLWAVSNKFIQTVVSGFASPHKSLILIWRFPFLDPWTFASRMLNRADVTASASSSGLMPSYGIRGLCAMPCHFLTLI